MEYRIESDSMGQVKVPADAYWEARRNEALKILKLGQKKSQWKLYGLLLF